jgi:hypothetical protein
VSSPRSPMDNSVVASAARTADALIEKAVRAKPVGACAPIRAA